MPSGKTHDRITLWLSPWITGIAFLLTRDGDLTLIVGASFLFSGLMFGPDLDIYSVQFKRWGKLRWIWLPYQKSLSHRSYLSHGPLIGTIIRLLYLLSLITIFAMLGVAIMQLFWGFDWNWQKFAQQMLISIRENYRQEAIAVFLGLELGAMSHSLSDFTDSTYKHYQKNRWSRFWSKNKKKRKPRTSSRRKL